MIVSETIEIPDREKPHSASLSVLKHILTETQFMSRNTPYDLLYESQQKATLQNWTS